MPTRDASSPARVLNTAAGLTQSWTTASFSPPVGRLFLHLCGNPDVTGLTPTWNTPTNTGTALTWTQVGTPVSNASGGAACVWTAYNASAQTNITVTGSVTWSAGVPPSAAAAAWVDVWTDCATSQTGAAYSGTTSTTQTNNPSITTTASGSRVAGMILDWAATGAPTSSDTIDAYTVAGQSSGGRAFKAADSGAPGSVSLNLVAGGGAPTNSLIVYEILAVSGPAITTQPESQQVPAGSTPQYSVTATGATSYQWQSNATGAWVDIAGATSSTYTTPALAAGSAYAVRVIVSDGTNSTTSDPADVWAPVTKPRPWAGLYGMGSRRSSVAIWPTSRAYDDILVDAIFGSVSGGAVAGALGQVTAVANATLSISGVASQTLAALTGSETGQLSVVGASSGQLGALSLSSTSAVAIIAASAQTLAALTSASIGATAIVGASAAMLDALAASSAAVVALAGSLSATLGAASTTSAGQLPVGGAGGGQLGSLTAAATASLAIVGAGASTLDALTLAAAGSSGTSGFVSATLADLTSAAAGQVAITGAAAATLEHLATASGGQLGVAGAGSGQLGSLTGAAEGALSIVGASAAALDELTVSAAGAVAAEDSGSVAVELDALTAASAGALAITGSASATLDHVVGSETGTLGLAGAGSGQLGALAASATAALAIVGDLAVGLDALSASATGSQGGAGQVAATLADLTVSATGELGAAPPQEVSGGGGAPRATPQRPRRAPQPAAVDVAEVLARAQRSAADLLREPDSAVTAARSYVDTLKADIAAAQALLSDLGAQDRDLAAAIEEASTTASSRIASVAAAQIARERAELEAERATIAAQRDQAAQAEREAKARLTELDLAFVAMMLIEG